MSDWYLEFFPSQPGKKGKMFSIGKKSILIGRAPNCDLRLNYKTISRNHAKLELIHSGLIVTDLNSSNGTYVNNKRIAATTELHAGDLLKMGGVKVFIRRQSASRSEELNPALYFPGEERRENIPTLPLYLGYNAKLKKAEATIDPYDDNNLIKVDLDDKGFFCRNIAGAHDVTINNMEFQRMRLQNGDTITIKGFDVIFEMYTGNKTGVGDSLGGIRAYDQNRSARRLIIYGGIALAAVVMILLAYLIYPRLQSQSTVDWSQVGRQVNDEVASQLASLEPAFTGTDELFNKSQQMFEPLMQFKQDYVTVRNQYLKTRKNKLVSLTASAVSPGALESIDGIFNSIDELYRLENDLDDFHSAHLAFYNALQSLPADTTEESLRQLRKVAVKVNQSYTALAGKLKTVQSAHSEISSATDILHRVSGLQIFDSLQGILFNLGRNMEIYTNNIARLQGVSQKISQMIPE